MAESQVLNPRLDVDITKDTLRSETRTIQRKLSDSGIISAYNIFGDTTAKITFKQLRKQPTEVQLRTLARISDQVSKALNVYQGFCNSGWEIMSESDRAHRMLEAWFAEMAEKGIHVNNLINENIYDLYILGGMAMRTVLVNESPMFIRNIPPENIDFLHQMDPDPANMEYGKIWYTGFYMPQNRTDFVVLESILDPNPYFYYAAMLTESGCPRGISIIESVIDLAIASGEKNYMMTEYLRGNIFPHEIVSLILEDYFVALADENIEFDIDKFNAVKLEAVQKVQKFIDEGDSTQTMVSDVPVSKIVLGTLEGNNLRGLPEINEAHGEAFPRALKCAATLLGARQQGSVLNDTQSKYEIRSMYKNILNIRKTIRAGWMKLCSSYLDFNSISEKAGIDFTDTDIELKQTLTEAIKGEAEAADTLVNMGAFTAQEMRQSFVRGALDLTQFEEAMPAEAEPAEPATEPEGDDDTDDE